MSFEIQEEDDWHSLLVTTGNMEEHSNNYMM